jgi:DNA replication protein DnaC
VKDPYAEWPRGEPGTTAEVLELPAPGPAIAVEPQRGHRGLRGFYGASQRGRLAADGSLLDTLSASRDYAMASGWRDPKCEQLRCWRPAVLRMVPPEERRCPLHGRQEPPSEDPFELGGQELKAARAKAWAAIKSKWNPPIRHDLDEDQVVLTSAMEAALAYGRAHDDYCCRAVILQGGPGSGKTTAIYSGALRELALDMVECSRKDDIRVYTFPQLSRLLLDEDERDETLEGLCECDELLLDDLGAGFTKPNGFVVACLEEALIHREARLYGCLMTTNLDPKKFRALFGERVFDRLRGEWGMWLNVDRPSFRTKPSKKASV